MEGRSLGDSRTGHHGGRYTLRSDGSHARAMHPGKPRIVRPDRRGVLEEGGRNYSLRRASVAGSVTNAAGLASVAIASAIAWSRSFVACW